MVAYVPAGIQCEVRLRTLCGFAKVEEENSALDIADTAAGYDTASYKRNRRRDQGSVQCCRFSSKTGDEPIPRHRRVYHGCTVARIDQRSAFGCWEAFVDYADRALPNAEDTSQIAASMMTCVHGQSQMMKKEEADVAAVSGLMGSPVTGAGSAALQSDAEIGSVGACLPTEPTRFHVCEQIDCGDDELRSQTLVHRQDNRHDREDNSELDFAAAFADALQSDCAQLHVVLVASPGGNAALPLTGTTYQGYAAPYPLSYCGTAENYAIGSATAGKAEEKLACGTAATAAAVLPWTAPQRRLCTAAAAFGGPCSLRSPPQVASSNLRPRPPPLAVAAAVPPRRALAPLFLP